MITKMTLCQRFKYAQIAFVAFLSLTLLGFCLLFAEALPRAVDYDQVFIPAALSAWRTGNPYVQGFYNPPWAILPLMPLALLPEAWGKMALIVMGLLSIAYVTKKLGGSPMAVGLILLSPPVLHGALNGNIDWLVALGFVLPPQIGLFFLVIKPQVGGVLALYYAMRAWRERRFIWTVGPVAVALLLSFLVYGFWPARAFVLPARSWNCSLWPYLIPVGLALIVATFRKCEARYVMPASLCLSPYVMFHSWVVGLLALSEHTLELAAAVIGLWILVAMRA